MIMLEHKRKRDSENVTNTPRKKSATSSRNGLITLKSITAQEDELPLVLAAPSAIKMPKFTMKAYTKHTADTPLSQQQLHIHSSTHPKLDFTGDENFGTGSDALLDHYVGIHDPATGLVTLHRAKRLRISTNLRPSQEQLDEASAKREYQTATALRHQLGMEFGTKKAKGMIKSLAENAIIQTAPGPATGGSGVDETTRALLASIGEAVAKMPTTAEQAALVTAAAPKPVADLSAKLPADVYPIHVLIPAEVLGTIEVQDLIEQTKSNEGVSTGSRFVSLRLQSAVQNRDTIKLKVLRYMLVMIELWNSLKSVGKSTKKLPPRKDLMSRLKTTSETLVDAVLRRFCISSPKEMNGWEIDNLITNLAAMSLYVDGWESDTTNLKDDLRMDIKKLLPYFRELGCQTGGMTEKDRNLRNISAENGRPRRMARLVIPLEFPEHGRARRKRGR